MNLEKLNLKETGRIILLTGPTASGKSHVSNLLQNEGIEALVSATTRKKRKREKGGRDYHFLTMPQFEGEIRKGNLVEWNTYADNHYGTLKSEVEKILDGRTVVTTTEIEGAVNFEENLREAYKNQPQLQEVLSSRVVPIFLGVKRGFVTKDRYFRRAGEGSILDPERRDDFRQRARRDWHDWQEHGHKFENVIINDGPIELAVDQVLNILKASQI